MVHSLSSDSHTSRSELCAGGFSLIEKFFSPRSIAVVGASNNPNRFGYNVMTNLIEAGFDGDVFPVSLKESIVFDRVAYKSILDVPGAVDLAIMIIPATTVPSAVEECGKKGIKAISILSGGFSEVGREGTELEEEVTNTAKRCGIRVVGPNCVGTMNTRKNLNASFVMRSIKGNMGLITQSGALGASCAYVSKREMLGFSKFVNLGNASDVSVPEIIRYYTQDPETRVIGIYLEGVKDGRKFLDAIGEATPIKPIVIVKAGRTEQGARAASSHTGSLAGSDKIYKAIFKQKGVTRVGSLFELIDVAKAFTKQPLPKGKRVGIITNAGGAGVLATDASSDYGLTISSLTQETVKSLRAFLPDVAILNNPVDIIASANKDCYRKTTETVASDVNTDALIVNCVVPTFLGMKPSEHAEGVVEAYNNSVKRQGKLLVCCWMAGELADPGREILENVGIPAYSSPERAALAVSCLANYNEFATRIKKQRKERDG
ncbi:MAG: CoA-binding protein [Candidatus Atabeyarchaeum deiterrae]